MDFITVPQAARLLEVTRQYAWKLIKNGKLNAKQVGKNFILTESDVKRYQKSTIKKKSAK
ncbi:MAG: helix-turn-helix domain-containing protein [Ignavibacteriaceae bacterium]